MICEVSNRQFLFSNLEYSRYRYRVQVYPRHKYMLGKPFKTCEDDSLTIFQLVCPSIEIHA